MVLSSIFQVGLQKWGNRALKKSGWYKHLLLWLFGIINAVVLLVIAFFGGSWFGLTPNQFETFKIALFILAAFSVLNWSTHIFSQLLIASENVAYTHKVNIVATLMNFAVVLITVYFKLT